MANVIQLAATHQELLECFQHFDIHQDYGKSQTKASMPYPRELVANEGIPTWPSPISASYLNSRALGTHLIVRLSI